MHQFDSYCESVILELDSTMTPPVSGAAPGQPTPTAPVDPSLNPTATPINIDDPNHPVQTFVKTLTTLPPEQQKAYLQKLGELLQPGTTPTH